MTALLTIEMAGWKTCNCNEHGSAGCPVHDAATDDSVDAGKDEHKVFAYDVLHVKDGLMQHTELDGVSAAHAWEEAQYECEGKTIAVRRGEYRGYNS